MSEALLEKIFRFLALSASENEHEAKNAAVHACRLLREGLSASPPSLAIVSPLASSPAISKARENVEAAMRSQGRGGAWADAPIRGTRRMDQEEWEAFKKRGYK